MARKDYIVGSGNVFEDLGHPRPAEALVKAELARGCWSPETHPKVVCLFRTASMATRTQRIQGRLRAEQ